MNEVEAIDILIRCGYVGYTAMQNDPDFDAVLFNKAIEMGVDSRVAISKEIDDDLYLEQIMSL